jgi:hypothetical protein
MECGYRMNFPLLAKSTSFIINQLDLPKTPFPHQVLSTGPCTWTVHNKYSLVSSPSMLYLKLYNVLNTSIMIHILLQCCEYASIYSNDITTMNKYMKIKYVQPYIWIFIETYYVSETILSITVGSASYLDSCIQWEKILGKLRNVVKV